MTDRRDDILDFLDGTLDEDKQAELRAWLDESPEHYEQFARLSFLHSAIGEQLRNDESTALFQLETLHRLPEQTPTANGLTRKDFVGAASYLLRHTFTPKRLAYTAAAAIVLLALVLFNPWAGNETPNDAPFATDTPNMPEESAQPIPRDHPVATLTAEHNAVWASPQAEGASAPVAPGSALTQGQRLTLTTGFAEITTNDGAIAIIEAPATIQLLNDNALHLYTGKLVGICETESSKGFVVRTPHMAITDLGTRFGVDASAADATEVHVLEGEVAARHADATPGTEPITLVAHQSARTSADTDTITAIDHDTDSFAHLLPSEQSPLALNNTDQLRTASNNPFFTAGQVDLVGVNFYFSHASGNPKNNASRDTPAGPVNGVAFDNIDMWNGATDIAPAPGPYALSANAAGPSLTITAPFTFNDSRSQRSRITGADAKHLRAVADEFLHLERKNPSITLTFTNLGVDEGTPLYVQLIGGDSGWHGGMDIRANGASIGAWAVSDRDITTAPLHAFETTAASDGRLTIDLTGTGSFAGLAGVIISAAPSQPTPPEQPRP